MDPFSAARGSRPWDLACCAGSPDALACRLALICCPSGRLAQFPKGVTGGLGCRVDHVGRFPYVWRELRQINEPK